MTSLSSRGVLNVNGPYLVDDGVLVPVEPTLEGHWYSPWEHKEIPSQLAIIEEGDEHAALDFVGRWGPLGFVSLFSRLRENLDKMDELNVLKRRGKIGEPLWLVWDHARTVRMLLRLLAIMWKRDEEAMGAYLDQIRDSYGAIPYAYGVRGMVSVIPFRQNLSGPLVEAAHIVGAITTDNIETLSPTLIAMSRETAELSWSHRTTALLPVVYAHIAAAAISSHGYYECAYRKCDRWWPSEERQGRRSLYCPPDLPTAESRCSRNERYYRSLDKNRSEAINGKKKSK